MHQYASQSTLTTGASFDVIVVGARAAGAASAMLLARGGLDVLVLERGALGADTLSTHAIMRGGVIQLSRWGVLASDTTIAGFFAFLCWIGLAAIWLAVWRLHRSADSR